MPQSVDFDRPPRLLTDFEVLQFLREMKSAQQRNTPTPLATITYEMLRYLEGTPSAQYTEEQVKQAIEMFSALPCLVTPAIVLQFVNNPPQTILDVQVILGEKVYAVSDNVLENIVQMSNDIFKR